MRAFLVLAALGMLGWVVTGTTLWLGQYGGDLTEAFASVWALATADWMLLLVLTDMLVFTIAALVWVALDLHARGASPPEVVAWLGPMLLFGSAVLLFYLARRAARPGAAPAAA